MKLQRREVKIAGVFIVLGILLGSLVAYAATPSSTFWISSGVYPGASSYTVWKEGSDYFAKDSNGWIEFSGTNASDLMQDSIDSVIAAQGGTILLIHGDYVLDTTLTIVGDAYYEAPVILRGEASHADSGRGTTLAYTGLSGAVIEIGDGTTKTSNVKIVDVAFVGDNTGGSIGIELLGGTYNTISRVKINEFEKGIVINSSSIANHYSRFEEIQMWKVGYGIESIGASHAANTNSFWHISISGDSLATGQIGVNLLIGEYNSFIQVYLHAFNLGIKLNDTWANTFINLVIDNGVTGINLTSNAIRDQFFNPLIVVSGTRINNDGEAVKFYGSNYQTCGTATILNGQTSVDVAHGLLTDPTCVTLGATHAEVVNATWSVDWQNITITVPNAVSGNRDVGYYANHQP